MAVKIQRKIELIFQCSDSMAWVRLEDMVTSSFFFFLKGLSQGWKPRCQYAEPGNLISGHPEETSQNFQDIFNVQNLLRMAASYILVTYAQYACITHIKPISYGSLGMTCIFFITLHFCWNLFHASYPSLSVFTDFFCYLAISLTHLQRFVQSLIQEMKIALGLTSASGFYFIIKQSELKLLVLWKATLLSVCSWHAVQGKHRHPVVVDRRMWTSTFYNFLPTIASVALAVTSDTNSEFNANWVRITMRASWFLNSIHIAEQPVSQSIVKNKLLVDRALQPSLQRHSRKM